MSVYHETSLFAPGGDRVDSNDSDDETVSQVMPPWNEVCRRPIADILSTISSEKAWTQIRLSTGQKFNQLTFKTVPNLCQSALVLDARLHAVYSNAEREEIVKDLLWGNKLEEL